MSMSVFKPLLRSTKYRMIIREVAKAHGLNPVIFNERIRAAGRLTSKYQKARMEVFYLGSRLLDYSLKALGNHLGRDHTIVLYAIDMVNEQIKHCPITAKRVTELEALLVDKFANIDVVDLSCRGTDYLPVTP